MDGSLAGFLVMLPVVERIAELEGLFVEPAWWRRGIGTALLIDAIEWGRAQGAIAMEVTANPQALGFYGAFGFVRLNDVSTRFGPSHRLRCSCAV